MIYEDNNRAQKDIDIKVFNQIPSEKSVILRSILENSLNSAIFILDENGYILEINRGVSKIFGYSIDDLKGKYFSILFTPNDKSDNLPEKELSNVLEAGASTDRNFIVHRSGKHIWAQGESVLLHKDGIKFIIKVINDLSREYELEQYKNKSIKDLKIFVYTASHDLKAPILNIEGLIDSLESALINNEDYSEILDLIKSSIGKFKTILNDLSETGKEQEKGEQDVYEGVSFQEIVDELLFAYNKQIESIDATITCDFVKAPIIHFSKKNLRSIIQNLLSNAIKFRSSQRKLQIKMSSDKTDEYIIFSIEDNGIGIKESDKKALFSMYNRLNENIEGSGVGLAIVSRIVDNNGGKVVIDSFEGKGSKFNIYIKDNPS
ncbi:sensor histidine kinase [Sporocytophaga myxococcoides]|uniref:sensor histidine kinase n=1 Tax=Sporocytophaga myxococcoides TaxID=153721 RepID=UPI0003FE3DC6|nr:PAS domain-containing sensor histidine kinase [Sporocytophaga myxococcoides]